MLKQKELTINLFEFVKDVTVVHDNVLPDLQVLLENVGYDGNAYLYPQQVGRAVRQIGEDVTVKHDNVKVLSDVYQSFGWDLRQEDVDMYIETREELRAVILKNEKSKCPNNPNFKGFKCDDCDCKDWD